MTEDGFNDFLFAHAQKLSGEFESARGRLENSDLSTEMKRLYVSAAIAMQETLKNANANAITTASHSLLFIEGMLKEHENATRNPVSGLRNKRVFEEDMRDVAHRAQRDKQERVHYAVVMCDGDKFKSINDELGHATGDAAIVKLGQILEGVTREDEHVYHWGGDEFALILRDYASNNTNEAKEHFSKAIDRFKAAFDGQTIGNKGLVKPLSMSFGFHVITQEDLHNGLRADQIASSVTHKADIALYKAKGKELPNHLQMPDGPAQH